MPTAVLRLAVAALATMGVSASPAGAQEAAQRAVCKKRSELIEVLAKKFGETQQSFGLQNDTRVLEVFASETGSWTAIVTVPGGKSCIVASGQAWTSQPILIGQPA